MAHVGYPVAVTAPGFLAIGSGPAGLSAAETFRARHRSIPVRILTSDPALPYAKPPLSKAFLCGRPTNLELHTPGWFVRQNVELVRGITVSRIDVANQEVVTAGGRRFPYWHLVVASGSTPVRLPVPGAEAALPLRSFADAVTLRMAALHASTAVVVGGGLIGCEAASCLASGGVATTMVAAEEVPLQRRFGVAVGERVLKMLADRGVRFVSGSVAAVDDGGVVLSSGEAVAGEVVVSAIGVRPDARLAVDAGLEVRDGRIVVDAHMHTSARNVYAAGDVALAFNVRAGRPVPAEHWRDAAEQGRVAGLTAAGASAVWDAEPGFACAIGDSVLRYHGWGGRFDACRVVSNGAGWAAYYSSGGESVGVLEYSAA